MLSTNKIGNFEKLMDYLEKSRTIPYLVFYKLHLKEKYDSENDTTNDELIKREISNNKNEGNNINKQNYILKLALNFKIKQILQLISRVHYQNLIS